MPNMMAIRRCLVQPDLLALLPVCGCQQPFPEPESTLFHCSGHFLTLGYQSVTSSVNRTKPREGANPCLPPLQPPLGGPLHLPFEVELREVGPANWALPQGCHPTACSLKLGAAMGIGDLAHPCATPGYP